MNSLRCVLLCLASAIGLSLLVVVGSQAEPKNPVVFVPGYLGSKLCDKATLKQYWPSLDFGALKLDLKSARDISDSNLIPCGLLDSRPSIWPPFKEDQYGEFIKFFRNIGYDDSSILFFDYDWRLSNFVNAKILKQEIIQEFGSTPVILIGHSMGGIIARILVQDPSIGGSALVKRIVTMGTPHRGSVDVFEMTYQGLGEEEGLSNLIAGGIPKIRSITLSFPSTYELLPSYDNCCFLVKPGGRTDAFDPFSAVVWKKFSWYSDAFDSARRIDFLKSALSNAEGLHKDILQKPLPPALEMDLRLIATGSYDTRSRVLIDGEGNLDRFVFKKGDGTVVLASSINGRKTSDLAIAPSVEQHGRIFTTDAAKEYLRNVLYDAPAPTAGTISSPSVLRAADGTEIPIERWRYRIIPSIGRAGDNALVRLELIGSRDLAAADLDNVRIGPPAPPNGPSVPMKRVSTQEERGDDGSSLLKATLEAHIKIPAVEGPYRVGIDIPNIGVFSDFALAKK